MAIVDRLLAAGRGRQAMSYVDRAVQAKKLSIRPPDQGDKPNPYWLDAARAVDLYLHDSRDDDAMGLVRNLFHATPTPATYDLLLGTAARLGHRDQERARDVDVGGGTTLAFGGRTHHPGAA